MLKEKQTQQQERERNIEMGGGGGEKRFHSGDVAEVARCGWGASIVFSIRC